MLAASVPVLTPRLSGPDNSAEFFHHLLAVSSTATTRPNVGSFDRRLLHEVCPEPTWPGLALARTIAQRSGDPRLARPAQQLLEVAASAAVATDPYELLRWRFGVAAARLAWALRLRNCRTSTMTQTAICRAVPWASGLLMLLIEAPAGDNQLSPQGLAFLQRLTAWRREVLWILDTQLVSLATARSVCVPQTVFRPLWSERLTMLLSVKPS